MCNKCNKSTKDNLKSSVLFLIHACVCYPNLKCKPTVHTLSRGINILLTCIKLVYFSRIVVAGVTFVAPPPLLCPSTSASRSSKPERSILELSCECELLVEDVLHNNMEFEGSPRLDSRLVCRSALDCCWYWCCCGGDLVGIGICGEASCRVLLGETGGTSSLILFSNSKESSLCGGWIIDDDDGAAGVRVGDTDGLGVLFLLAATISSSMASSSYMSSSSALFSAIFDDTLLLLPAATLSKAKPTAAESI